jgi:alpha-beta hydrolase superfamily lysophospholipase
MRPLLLLLPLLLLVPSLLSSPLPPALPLLPSSLSASLPSLLADSYSRFSPSPPPVAAVNELQGSLEAFLARSTLHRLPISNCTFSVTRPSPNTTPKHTLLLFPGWGECLLKYHPLISTLTSRLNCTIITLDHPSQGLSPRLRGCGQTTYVPSHRTYLSAASELAELASSCPSLPPLARFLGPSLGAGIGLHLSMSGALNVTAAAFSAPMICPALPYPPFVSAILLRLLSLLGLSSRVASLSPRSPPPKSYHLPSAGITHSPLRLAHWETLRRLLPDIIVSTPSVAFARALLSLRRSLLSLLRRYAPPAPPRFLFLLPQEDSYVRPAAARAFAAKLGRKAPVEVALYPGSYHDVLEEEDKVRDDAVGRIVRLFEEHGATVDAVNN